MFVPSVIFQVPSLYQKISVEHASQRLAFCLLANESDVAARCPSNLSTLHLSSFRQFCLAHHGLTLQVAGTQETWGGRTSGWMDEEGKMERRREGQKKENHLLVTSASVLQNVFKANE